jgi:YHS domain-containing protein
VKPHTEGSGISVTPEEFNRMKFKEERTTTLTVKTVRRDQKRKSFMKCDLCNREISDEKCELAAYKRVINGEEYSFCCRRRAQEFERTRKQT